MACEPRDTGDSSSISESEVSEEVSGYISYFICYYNVERKMKYSVNVSQRVREGGNARANRRKYSAVQGAPVEQGKTLVRIR